MSQTQPTKAARSEPFLAELRDSTPLAAVLQRIVSLYLQGARTLLVADRGNHVIRAVSLDDCSVRTLAGQPRRQSCVDGEGNTALFDTPQYISIDTQSGTAFVTETGAIRCVTDNGVVTTCKVLEAANSLRGSVISGHELFVTDPEDSHICCISLKDNSCHDRVVVEKTKEKQSQRSSLRALTADLEGNVFVSDLVNRSILKLSERGVVSTIAGGGSLSTDSHEECPATQAKIFFPSDIEFTVLDGKHTLLVVDSAFHWICAIDLASSTARTFAGMRGMKGHINGRSEKAMFCYPLGIVADRATEEVFVSCADHTIRRIHCGEVSTVCGREGENGHCDGRSAKFNMPTGLALVYEQH